MHHLTHLNQSTKVPSGRVSNELFEKIDSERQFDRYNRLVKSKKLAQQKLVANIQNALATKRMLACRAVLQRTKNGFDPACEST